MAKAIILDPSHSNRLGWQLIPLEPVRKRVDAQPSNIMCMNGGFLTVGSHKLCVDYTEQISYPTHPSTISEVNSH